MALGRKVPVVVVMEWQKQEAVATMGECAWSQTDGTDLDSSGARFEAADLNGGRVDEEAAWFCSDAMAEVAGQLEFRSTIGRVL